ncbi:NAD(P)/FAD-dependent oxidoreductase [Ahniella affigens]|nr:NAD(P)/FAD-dependent oxidoreductase [Ahniella affigens]
MDLDVAIIGAGPGGTTCAALIKKYLPRAEVGLFERAHFPREHIGESQLPQIGYILAEMGCWDAVEAAGFPIKIGATYRWGNDSKLWDFEFTPAADYVSEPRPRQFSDQARQLAFQVDRRIYDQILAAQAEQLGATVHFGQAVRRVLSHDDEVHGLQLDNGKTIRAKWYIDATGNSGLLRRAMQVGVSAPTKLQNVAFWDYWDDADWAVRATGDATRVLVLSIGCGWIWFIPINQTRTSIGFVCPASFYRDGQRNAEELYSWALAQEPLIGSLTTRARRSGEVQATKDWSFLADRLTGKNWMLVGEAAGFADPILAAGLTLTQTGAREAAYTVVSLLRQEHEPRWLLQHYSDNQRARIRQHIRFADFWYSANGAFTDLQDYTREIARDAGLDLNPQQAFQWLGTGGFTHDLLGQAVIGGFDLGGVRQLAQRLVNADENVWTLSHYNRFRLDLDGAVQESIPAYIEGRIHAVPCLHRGPSRLPLVGAFLMVVKALQKAERADQLLRHMREQAQSQSAGIHPDLALRQVLMCLELLVNESWVRCEHIAGEPCIVMRTPKEGGCIHSNIDLVDRIEALTPRAEARL